MAEVRFHPEAQAEYQTALAWYQARGARVADRFEMEVDCLLGLVVATPRLFPSYDPTHRFAMLRRFPDSVVYLIEPDAIDVSAIAHSHRSPGDRRGRI